MEHKRTAFDIIKSFVGNDKYVSIPISFIKITGGHISAMMLSQLIYWSDRTSNGNGWVYKSSKEWQDELLITDYAVRQTRKTLEDLHLIETTVMKDRSGTPKVHYKVCFEMLYDLMEGYVECQRAELSVANTSTCGNSTSPIITNNINNNISHRLQTEITNKYSVCDGENYVPQMIDFVFNDVFEKLKSEYPKNSIGISNARKIIKNLFDNGFTDNQGNVTIANHHLVSLAIRSYAAECKENEVSEQYVKNFDNFLSNYLPDYYEKKKETYIEGMKENYGENWDKVKFRYL